MIEKSESELDVFYCDWLMILRIPSLDLRWHENWTKCNIHLNNVLFVVLKKRSCVSVWLSCALVAPTQMLCSVGILRPAQAMGATAFIWDAGRVSYVKLYKQTSLCWRCAESCTVILRWTMIQSCSHCCHSVRNMTLSFQFLLTFFIQ